MPSPGLFALRRICLAAPIASVEELIKRRIRVELAHFDKAAALDVLSEFQTKVKCGRSVL